MGQAQVVVWIRVHKMAHALLVSTHCASGLIAIAMPVSDEYRAGVFDTVAYAVWPLWLRCGCCYPNLGVGLSVSFSTMGAPIGVAWKTGELYGLVLSFRWLCGFLGRFLTSFIPYVALPMVVSRCCHAVDCRLEQAFLEGSDVVQVHRIGSPFPMISRLACPVNRVG